METLLAVLTSMMLSYAPYNATDVLIDKDEAFCLAQNVYHEAKGENLNQVNLVVDCDPGPAFTKAWQERHSCLMASRPNGPRITRLGRRMNVEELM